MPDLPSPGPFITEPTFTIFSNVNTDGVQFTPPGNTSIAASGNPITMCIQPGTMRNSITQDGDIKLVFLAFKSVTNAALDFTQDQTVGAIRSLFNEAEKAASGMIHSRVVKMHDGIKGASDAAESVILGGSIHRADHEIVNRFNSKNANLYRVEILRSSWSEYSVSESRFTNLSCHGGITYTKDNSGTADGRVEYMNLIPTAGYGVSSDDLWQHVWVGVKPNLSTTGQAIRDKIFSQIKVAPGVVVPQGVTSNKPLNSTTDYPEFIDGKGIQIDFVHSAIASSTEFTNWNSSESRSQAAWGPRFAAYYVRWVEDAEDYAEFIPGKYRLLGRIQMPPISERNYSPSWGVRARMSYTRDGEEYREIGRGPEIYLPNSEYGDGGALAYYDLGTFDISPDLATLQRNTSHFLSLYLDAVLLGIDTNETVTANDAEYYKALTKNWLRFDDFRLVPAESSLFVKLPVNIKSDERLELVVDEYGNYNCYVVERNTFDPRIRYRVSDVVPGENGFSVPGGGGHAVVVVADKGPEATISSTGVLGGNINVRPRIMGSEL